MSYPPNDRRDPTTGRVPRRPALKTVEEHKAEALRRLEMSFNGIVDPDQMIRLAQQHIRAAKMLADIEAIPDPEPLTEAVVEDVAELRAERDRWEHQATQLARWNSNQARTIAQLKGQAIPNLTETIEARIAEANPIIYALGEVVRDARGEVWVKVLDGWLRPGYLVTFTDRSPVLPLTRLVAEK